MLCYTCYTIPAILYILHDTYYTIRYILHDKYYTIHICLQVCSPCLLCYAILYLVCTLTLQRVKLGPGYAEQYVNQGKPRFQFQVFLIFS